MNDFEINITSLLKAAGIRGYTPRASAALNKALRADDAFNYQKALSEASDAIYESDFQTYSKESYFEGLPVYMPVVLTLEGESLTLDSAITSISRSKNIVSTAVQGRPGTVKEYIAAKDWSINIKGILSVKKFDYPIEKVVEFGRYMNADVPLGIEGKLFQKMKIYNIVVTEWQLPHNEHINCATYSISAVSDVPVELKIDELEDNEK